MDIGGCGVGEGRSALEGARDALEDFVSVVGSASGAELAELMSLVDAVAAGAGAARVVLVVEAVGRGEVGSGEAHGWVREHAPLLSPAVVRGLACAAALVPHVLGAAGESLDLGRVVRLFTEAQRRVLLRRDRGCTYPGCSAPAAWTKAHHVVHWLDGGASDIDNAALLCQRHHTIVHDRRYIAQVRDAPDEAGRFVVWDRTHGSYDRHLQRLKAERAVADPRPLTPDRLAELLDAIHADEAFHPQGPGGPGVSGGPYWARVQLDLERHEHERWRQAQDWAELRADMPPPDEPDPEFSYRGSPLLV